MASAGFLANEVAERLRVNPKATFKEVLEDVLIQYGDSRVSGLRSEIGRILANRKNGNKKTTTTPSHKKERKSWLDEHEERHEENLRIS